MIHFSSLAMHTLVKRLKAAAAAAFLIALTTACARPSAQPEASIAPEPASGPPKVYAILRAPPGTVVSKDLADAIAAAHEEGLMPYALRLESTQQEKPGFSSVFVLGFKDESALSSWQQQAVPLLGTSIELLLADRLFHEENEGRDSSVAVFQGNFMQPKVDRARFASFANRYMRKYLELQREAGILTSYSMYQVRPASSGEELAFMVREHTDQSTFDDRNSVKDRLREELMARDADYKQLEDTAIQYRAHLSSTTARSVPIP